MMLTRYLEVSPRQDYLVQRIQGEEEEVVEEEEEEEEKLYALVHI